MKKTNNKGFSLVELIVVIAIMAVLVGVLAPQFLKYVERGRKSTDVQNVQALISACDAYAADPMVADGDKLVTVDISLSTTPVSVGTTTPFEKALTAAGIKTYGLKSANWGTPLLEITVTDGVPSYAVTGCSSGNDLLKGTYK